MIEWDSTDIRRRIDDLSRSPNAPAVFGSAGHHFQRLPCVRDDELRHIEGTRGFVLPADFREFVMTVESGGAGPGYGLFPIGRWGDAALQNEPWPDDWWDLAEPFPHDAPWNLGEDELKGPDGTDEELDAWFELKDEKYFNPRLVNGSIPIAHLGCAMWVRLIVSGDRAGELWLDDRASDEGIYPVSPVRFIDWFLSWLGDAEASAGRAPDRPRAEPRRSWWRRR